MNGNQYYVRIRNLTLGPYAIDAVRQMIRKAQIGRATEVSTDGMSWGPASGFPELFDLSAAVAAGSSAAVETASDPLGFDNLLGNAGSVAPPGGGPRSLVWHYTMKGLQQSSPIDQQALINLIVAGHVGADDNVWNETMSNWARVADVSALAGYALPASVAWPVEQAVPTSGGGKFTIHGERAPDYDTFIAKRVPAGVIALFLGNLGIHKFMLGLTTAGITMLILFFLIIPIPVLAVVSLIEGIVYLTKSEQQFYNDYAINRKQWF